jgi:hypothetical protein
MPVTRKSLEQTSILRKLLGYHQAWRQGLPAARFGFQNVRTLFVTSSPERAQSMFVASLAATFTVSPRMVNSSLAFAHRFILARAAATPLGVSIRLWTGSGPHDSSSASLAYFIAASISTVCGSCKRLHTSPRLTQ